MARKGTGRKEEQVPKEVLLDGAQMSLSAMIAGTMGFLKTRNIPIKDWVEYMGEQFEGAWEEMEDRELEDIMSHLMTFEVLPLGVEVVSSRASADRVEVIVTPLPDESTLEKFGTTPEDFLSQFDITRQDFAQIYAMYEAAASNVGLRLTHELNDSQEILALERR